MATQSYFGMPMPQTGTSPTDLTQSQTAAQTGTSSSPLQSSLPTTSSDTTSTRSLSTEQTQPQSQDYSGGNPYLTGLNYGTQPAPATPQSSIPTGGTLQPVQTQAAAQTAGTSNIFGNTTPPALANIPNIRQNPNGQWSDGEGRLYNPTTGAVFYDPGPAGWNGPGAYTGAVPQYQPTPYQPPAPQQPAQQGSTWNNQAATQQAASSQMTTQPVNQPVMNVASSQAPSSPTTTWSIDPATGLPQGIGGNPTVTADPTSGRSLAGGVQGAIPGGGMGGGGQTPTPQYPQVSPTGAPNSYNPFQNYQYPPNTTDPIMFSGNQGPRPYATGQVPEGWGQQPSFSPQFSEGYYNWLYNQLGRGATPYGQQQTFLPGQGGSSMQGLTAPETPLAAQGRQGLQDFTQYMGGMIDPARLSSLQSAYGPYSQVGQQFAEHGGYGAPGQEIGLQAQYGARGNPQDPYGLFTGAQSLQGAASGQGMPGAAGSFLNSAIQSGNPTDVGPAWDAMRQAQQRNIDQQAAQIREKMGLSGNLGLSGGGEATASTPYHTALTDFYSQTARDQNANLTAASQQAQEAARARQMSAGQFGSQQQNATSQYLQNLMSQAANTRNQGQLAGAGLGSNITNMSQQTPYGIYGNLLGMQQGNINNLASLGQQYQGLDQAAINRQYQEYLRTQGEYSPLLGQFAAAANTFPGVYNQQYGTGLGGIIGQVAGSALGSGGAASGSKPWWVP